MLPLRYDIELVKVIDGDTIICNINNIINPIFFNILSPNSITLLNQRIRLFGIDAPEIFGNEKIIGLRSKNYLTYIIHNTPLQLEIHHRIYEKYGRIIGIVYCVGFGTPDINVNQLMIEEGYAFPATYVGGKYVRSPRYYTVTPMKNSQFPFR